MPINLRVIVKGYKVGELSKLGIRFQRPREVMRQLAEARQSHFNFKMRYQLNYDYKVTKRLSVRYKRWKDRNYPGKVIRERTGDFKNSYKVIVYDRSIRETITDPKVDFIQATRPIIPPNADSVPFIEQRQIDEIALKFFKKSGFK
jgi:hypothetical protein